MTNRLAGLTAGALRILGQKADASEEEPEAPAVEECALADEPADEGEAAAEDAPVADDGAAQAAAEAALNGARADATAAANARWAAVLRHEAAAGRTAQAITLLEATELAPDAIASRLTTFPKEGASSFADRMSEVENPSITGGQEIQPGAPDAQAGWGKAVSALPNLKRK